MADFIIKSAAGTGNKTLIQGADASPAITIAETGTTTFAENVTMSGTANNIGTVTAGSLAFQSMVVWRMVNSETKGHQSPLGAGGSDWEIADDNENEFYLGSSTQITESSGIFAFGSTGYWSIRGYFTIGNADDTTVNTTMRMMTSNNGSGGTYSTMTQTVWANTSQAVGHYIMISGECIIKVTDTSNDFYKTEQANDPDTFTVASGSYNYSYVVFTKLAEL